MKQHQITIKDIARALGISPSTVSRALKNHPDISEETKQQVRELAANVNYRPNAVAISLRQTRTNTLGIVIPEIVHHFFSTVISGIDDEAFEQGFSTMICQTNESREREKRAVLTLLDKRVDGVLVSVSKTTDDVSHLRAIQDNGTPIVFFDRICEQIESNRVTSDDYEGARIAVHHLVDVGCRRIAILRGSDHMLISRQRRDGYVAALREHGLEIREDFDIEADSAEGVRAAADKIITIATEIDGIFAINDDTAIAAIKLLQRNSYRVPDDIAVIGFGDGPSSELVSPTLSTVQQKGYEIGREAAQMLIAQVKSDLVEVDYETRIFTPVLRQRESTTRNAH